MSPIEKFRKLHGPKANCEKCSPSVLKKYADKISSGVLDEWRENGWCSYAQGQIWLVDPDAYAQIIEDWLPDWSSQNGDRPIVFARSALGDLLVSRGGEVGHLNVHYGRYVQIGDEADVFLGYTLDKNYLADAMDGKLALQAIKKFGPLASDEMFTFEPALALGGAPELKYMKKVKLFPQLSILVQLFDEVTIE
jgi:hypothetical protein